MIYVDLPRLMDHLDLLQEELQQAVRLSETLRQWIREEPFSLGFPSSQLRKQLEFSEALESRIRQRILILESAVSTFSTIKRTAERDLEDALRLLNQ